MGTRSDIIVQRRDGTWKRVYCHWDGYPTHNGRILVDHYSDQKKAEKLVAPGDMSVLGPEVGEKHPFDWRDPIYEEAKRRYPGDYAMQRQYEEEHPDTKKFGEMCLYYGRDRGEKNTRGKIGKTLMEVWPPAESWTEFTYVWDGHEWLVSSPEAGEGALVPVVDVLAGRETVQANVKFPLGILGKWKPTSTLIQEGGK